MSCPPPETRFETVRGVRHRIKVFKRTAEWSMGDLLSIAGRPTLFINVTLYEKEIPGVIPRWENIGGCVIIADEIGFREMTAEEFDAVSDDIRIIARYNDIP